MALIRWKPFQELEELFGEAAPSWLHNNNWDLAADVYQDHGTVIVEMHTAGIDPDKIDLEIEENHLHIRGTREQKEETKHKHYFKREIRRGTFERIIDLPCPVIAEKTQADVKNGVLRITIPKHTAKKAHKVSVSKGSENTHITV